MEEELKEKVEYCLNCMKPQCQMFGCPLGNHIPQFIQKVKNGDYQGAYEVLCQTTVLPAICGRICPHFKQCQGKCIRGMKGEPVSIGEIEAFIGDWALQNPNALAQAYAKIQGEKAENSTYEANSKKKVAVIGGGPAGITCSAFLRQKGFKVTIYEKYDSLGGILKRGIPDFRLPKDVLEKTINQILNLGIEVKYEQELGRNLYIEDIQTNYDAVFLSMGANIPRKMMIEGEELSGVFGGNTLLELGNHPEYQHKKVAVIGGGNVAMDCARTIKRLGAEKVTVIYRRAEEQMPAETKEIEEAKQEGVEFLFQTNITKIIGKDKVEQIECIKMELVEKPGETRKVPVEISNSNYSMNMDYVVMAVGAKVDIDMLSKQKLPTTLKNYLEIDENNRIEGTNIFAGGDIVGQTATVAWAASDGRKVAEQIATVGTENLAQNSTKGTQNV